MFLENARRNKDKGNQSLHEKYDQQSRYYPSHDKSAFYSFTKALPAQSGETLDNELLCASMNNDYLKIEDLIEAGANVNVTTLYNPPQYKSAYSALDLAIDHGAVDSVAMLLKYDVDKNYDDPDKAYNDLIIRNRCESQWKILTGGEIERRQLIAKRIDELLTGKITPKRHFHDLLQQPPSGFQKMKQCTLY